MYTYELFIFILICILSFFIIKRLLKLVLKFKTLPPGPWGLPLIGFTPWISKRPFETFVNIGKKYGNVFSVTLGKETVIILNDWTSIQETLVDKPRVFSGRPSSFLKEALGNSKGIGFSEGELWKTQRNASIQILRKIGIGNKSMEDKAMDIVHEIMDVFDKAENQALKMETIFFGPILKVNWKFISGDDIKNSTVNLKDFENALSSILNFLQNNWINSFPWLRHLPPSGFGFSKIKRLNDTLLSYLRKVIADHVTKSNEKSPEDFIDYFLNEINKRKRRNENLTPPFTTDHLSNILFSLFAAAVDTTNATTQWGLLYLSLYPSVQKNAQDELDNVIGRHRLPNMSDMPNLPYLNALIMEIHRLSCTLPMAIPHKTTEDTVISGYKIPKGTTCIQNTYAVHHDPLLWDQPEVFKPERFIHQNNAIRSPPYLIPFSIGPRLCIGQSLAEMELKLIFSCLLHRFNLSVPPGRPSPTLQPFMSGLILKPNPYSLLVQRRN